jgi:L-ascorbate metabolism protein UlaG (beta-lactamase superfamily)
VVNTETGWRGGRAEQATTLRLPPGGQVQLRYAGAEKALVYDEVTCQLLFLGSRVNRLAAAYAEVVDRFSSLSDNTELRRALTSSSLVRELYQVGGTDESPCVLLRDSIFLEPGPDEDLRFDFRVRRGRRVVTRQVTVDRLPALGALCPLLWGTHHEAEVRSVLEGVLPPEQESWAGDVLSDLVRHALVEPGSAAVSRFEPRPPLPTVSFLGHATLLFQTPRTSVLFDPLVRPDAGGSLRGTDVATLDVGAICCSHSHWDHCNLQTLLLFDKATPVIVPRVTRPTAFNPPLVSALRRLGFTDIREVGPWEPVTIGDVEVVPTPFHGEQDEPGAEIDHLTYVVRTGGLTVYGGADCYRDTFGDMEPILEEVARRYRPDIAFLPISKAVLAYRYGGNNNFCRYLDRRLLDRSFQYTAGPEDTARLAQVLDPRLIVPYATFTLARWDTPQSLAHFRRELRARHLDGRLHPLRPLDSLDASAARRSWWRRRRRYALVLLFRAAPVVDAVRRAFRRAARMGRAVGRSWGGR